MPSNTDTRAQLSDAALVVRRTLEHGLRYPPKLEASDYPAMSLLPFFESEGPRMRPSGKRCRRYHWYSHHEPEKAKPDPNPWLWIQGHLWEAIALEILARSLPAPYSLMGWRQKEVEVQGLGVTGHIDDALAVDGKPFAGLDCKNIGQFAHGLWTEGRIPDDAYGYMNQAGVYMLCLEKELGYELAGFLWPTQVKPDGFKKPGFTACGYAYREEIYPYGVESLDTFAAVQTNPTKPLPRCQGYPDKVPCRAGTFQCEFRDHCTQDQR